MWQILEGLTGPLLQAIHHPFTAPQSDYLEGRCSPKDATALAYDLVLNGCEIGGEGHEAVHPWSHTY